MLDFSRIEGGCAKEKNVRHRSNNRLHLESAMHFFIDESGSFTLAPDPHAISLVGALVVPDARLTSLEEKYARLRADLPKEGDEVKGRLLSENQIADVVTLLSRHQVLFEATAVDMGSAAHNAGDVAAHQAAQAEGITRHLTPDHHPNIHREMADLRRRLEEMSPQLYVQSAATFALIERVVQNATLYYAQRIPKELAAFHWVIDGKDKERITDWESWWSYGVRPALQYQSLKKPLAMLRDADYSHFQRFQTKMADYLKPHIESSSKSEDATNINLLMTESFRFSASNVPGLELVDILANATRRALVGNLDVRGWRDIPSLMIHDRRHYIQLIALHSRPMSRLPPYMEVLQHFTQGGKDMVAPRFRETSP